MVAVGEVLDGMAPRILPIVEDLRAEDVQVQLTVTAVSREGPRVAGRKSVMVPAASLRATS